MTDTKTSICSKKPSMKRRRPWKYNTVVAASVFMGLWRNSNGIPVAFGEDITVSDTFSSKQLPAESNVTPFPSPVPKVVPIRETPSTAQLATFEERSSPVNVDMILNISSTVGLKDLIRDVEELLEEHLLEGLSNFEESNDDLSIRGVNIAITLLGRRRVMLRQLQQGTRVVSLEVQGSVKYITTSPEITDLLSSQLETFFVEDNLNKAIEKSEIGGSFGFDDAGLNKERQRQIQQEGDFDEANNGNNNGLERPSTLDIAIGFSLVGSTAVGLLIYVYIYCRKRRKRLARKKQMQESISYRMPNKMSTTKRPPPKASVVTQKSEGSDGSSYNGAGSRDSTEDQSDSFAKELQMAATLDQQAWDNFQRKKNALNRHEVRKPSDTAFRTRQPNSQENPDASSQWAKSFPYGDEELEGIEEGAEWTAADGDDVSDWGPYNQDSRVPNTSTRVEEKKDEYGARYGNVDLQTQGDNNTSALVSEVGRLSRFVQRYEKRKERRLQRGSDRNISNSDESWSNNLETSNDSSLEWGKPAGFGQIGRQSAKTTTFTGSVEDVGDPPLAFNDETMQVSDDESSEDSDTQRSNQRLGISPYSVQKPGERSSSDAVPMQKPPSGFASSNDRHSSNRRPREHSGEEGQTLASLRGNSSITDQTKRGLSLLRANNAIIDSSQSDVNVGTHPTSFDDQTKPPPRSPNVRTPRESKNGKFSKLFNLFEERPKNAVFPPGKEWQNGGSRASPR